MPIWVRAIIFGVELIGFIALCFFATRSMWKWDIYPGIHMKEKAIKNLKSNIVIFTVIFGVILLVFFFAYPSLIFLSYNKLIAVTTFVLAASICIMVFVFEKPSSDTLQILLPMLSIAFVIVATILMVNSWKIIDNNTLLSEKKEPKQITPVMYYNTQIGYTYDDEGNIESYIFYHREDGDWNLKTVKASEAKVTYLEYGDSYIVENTINKEYQDTERKEAVWTEISYIYEIYINSRDMIEVRTN